MKAPTRAEVGSWIAAAKGNALFRWGVVAAAAIAIIDQISKFWIVNVVKLPDRLQPCALHPEDM